MDLYRCVYNASLISAGWLIEDGSVALYEWMSDRKLKRGPVW